MLCDKDQFDNVVATYRLLSEENAEAQRYKALSKIVNFKFFSISGLFKLLFFWIISFLLLILFGGILLMILPNVFYPDPSTVVQINKLLALILNPVWSILLPIVTSFEGSVINLVQLVVPSSNFLIPYYGFQLNSASIPDMFVRIFFCILIYGEILLTILFIWKRARRASIKRKQGPAIRDEMANIEQRSQERQTWLNNSSIVPASHRNDLDRVGAFASYMEEGRATNLTEAINLYYYEVREKEREQRRLEEERRYHNEQLRLESEKVNAINDLKAEQRRANEELEYQSRIIRFDYK